ncbi:proline-rich receptor-like protein kinase PERK9 [Hyalella azteca]|uniref:Proline-rich receptor-like protein kinase PERK9 n=1 Tax=Hyalella azteca TaxID=294128 RepID=A0A979FSP2_HYAAZ|nr:proline-rich receptor-like protein kinase PERK9 [Hyalella azteca]
MNAVVKTASPVGEILVLHHPTTISTKYQAMVHVGPVRQTASIVSMDRECLRTGDKALVHFRFIKHPEYLQPGLKMVFREGRTKAVGKVLEVIPKAAPSHHPHRNHKINKMLKQSATTSTASAATAPATASNTSGDHTPPSTTTSSVTIPPITSTPTNTQALPTPDHHSNTTSTTRIPPPHTSLHFNSYNSCGPVGELVHSPLPPSAPSSGDNAPSTNGPKLPDPPNLAGPTKSACSGPANSMGPPLISGPKLVPYHLVDPKPMDPRHPAQQTQGPQLPSQDPPDDLGRESLSQRDISHGPEPAVDIGTGPSDGSSGAQKKHRSRRGGKHRLRSNKPPTGGGEPPPPTSGAHDVPLQ